MWPTYGILPQESGANRFGGRPLGLEFTIFLLRFGYIRLTGEDGFPDFYDVAPGASETLRPCRNRAFSWPQAPKMMSFLVVLVLFEAQFHLHMPSEHLINGRQYSAELHVVHTRQRSVGQETLGVAEPLTT